MKRFIVLMVAFMLIGAIPAEAFFGKAKTSKTEDIKRGTGEQESPQESVSAESKPGLAEQWLFNSKVFEGDKFCLKYTFQAGDSLSSIAKKYRITREFLMELNGIPHPDAVRPGTIIKVINGPFHIVVYLSTSTMDLYLQDTFIKSMPAGLGQSGSETPTGLWSIKQGGKLIKPLWADPDTGRVYQYGHPEYPLGSRWIGLEGISGEAKGRDGFGIHGSKDPSLVGIGSTKGCICLSDSDAVFVYNLLVPAWSHIKVIGEVQPIQDEPKVSSKQELVDALEDLMCTMIKKINFEVDVTAQCFTSVKEYWRAKRWADLLGPVLRVIQNTLSILCKITDVATLSRQTNLRFNNSQYASEVISVFLMYNGLKEAGGKLHYAIDGPTYIDTVKEMLKAADSTTVAGVDFDAEHYKMMLEACLESKQGDIDTPLIIARTSKLAPDHKPARGAYFLRRIIREEFRMLIDQIQDSNLPQDFPIGDIVNEIKQLKRQIGESGVKNTEARYTIYQKEDWVHQSRALGAIAELNKAFSAVSHALGERVKVEIYAECAKLTATGADVVYILTYKIPGVGEVAKMTQQATLIPQIVIQGKKTFSVDTEEEFYQIPQEMLFSSVIEFSSLWRIADDTVYSLMELLKKDDFQPPLTIVDGLATALVIDKSGSMSGEKIKRAKEAAYTYVDTSPEKDFVSLAAFSTNAESISEPVSIATAKETLKKDILSVSSGGSTNVGAGLTIAFGHLSSYNFKDRRALLMSDGRHNTGTYKPEVAKFQSKGWPIYTVAFGRDADQEMLDWIANQTGGIFYPAESSDIASVYHKINVLAHNGSVYRSYNDFIRTGEKLAYNIPVEPDMKKVGFFTNWQGSRMETVLFSPNKTVINRSNISNWGRFVEGETHNCYEIDNPQCGTWQVLITGYNLPTGGEQVNFHSFCQSDFFSNVLGFQPNYSQNQEVRIGVKLAEVIDGRLSPLRGAQITAEIKKPSTSLNRFAFDIKRKRLQPTTLFEIFREISGRAQRVTLFDDGLHKDVMPGDGIYANTYNETTINGPYLVTIDCQAHTSQGMSVKRILQESFQVGPIEQNSLTVSDFLDLIKGKGSSPQLQEKKEEIKEKAVEKVIDTVFDQLFKR